MSEKTIVQALAAVMGDVRAVGKTGRNSAQNYNFRGIDAVVNAVGPALREHGVVVIPEVLNHSHETVSSANGKAMGHVVVRVAYTFVGPAGDDLTATVIGEAMDYGDKATAKAMSVAFRTALLQSLALPTDEPDPDSESFERADQSARRAPAGKVSGADDARVPDLVDEFTAVRSEEDLAAVSQKVSAMDVGDEGRNTLRDAYRAAKAQLEAQKKAEEAA